MQKEIETRFLDINKDELVKKLASSVARYMSLSNPV
jgi:hypothetical protein